MKLARCLLGCFGRGFPSVETCFFGPRFERCPLTANPLFHALLFRIVKHFTKLALAEHPTRARPWKNRHSVDNSRHAG